MPVQRGDHPGDGRVDQAAVGWHVDRSCPDDVERSPEGEQVPIRGLARTVGPNDGIG